VGAEVEMLGRYSRQIPNIEKFEKLLVPSPDPPKSSWRSGKQLQKRLSATELDAYSAAYQAGSSIRELAQQFKINRTTVLGHVDRLGLPHRYPVLTTEEIEEAARLYRSGLSLTTLAKTLPASAESIRKALTRSGVVLRNPHHRSRG
jgi:transposase-like protein